MSKMTRFNLLLIVSLVTTNRMFSAHHLELAQADPATDSLASVLSRAAAAQAPSSHERSQSARFKQAVMETNACIPTEFVNIDKFFETNCNIQLFDLEAKQLQALFDKYKKLDPTDRDKFCTNLARLNLPKAKALLNQATPNSRMDLAERTQVARNATRPQSMRKLFNQDSADTEMSQSNTSDASRATTIDTSISTETSTPQAEIAISETSTETGPTESSWKRIMGNLVSLIIASPVETEAETAARTRKELREQAENRSKKLAGAVQRARELATAKRKEDEVREKAGEAAAARAKNQADKQEAKRLADEAESKKLAEVKRLEDEATAKRLAEEREAKRKEDEAKARAREEEAATAKQLADEREAKRLAEEAEARKLAEAKRLEDEAKARQQAEEREAKRKEDEVREKAREAAAARANKKDKAPEAAAAKRLADEAAAKRLADEAAAKRLADEAAAKRLADEAAAKRLADEAAAKRLADEAAAKRLADEAAAKRLADDAEAKRIADEAEAKRIADEAEAKRIADEAEAKRIADEAEAKRIADEAEAKRIADEAEAKRIADEAEAKRIADEAEAKRIADEAAKGQTKSSLISGKKLLAGAGLVGLIATLIKKIFYSSEVDKQGFRSIQTTLQSTYTSNPRIIDELNELHRTLGVELAETGTLSDTSEQALKAFFDLCGLKTFTQSLQAIANNADADFKNEWNAVAAKHAEFIAAWQNIRTVLTQKSEHSAHQAVSDLTHLRDTLNEMSLYLDLINRACELPLPH